MSPEQLQLLQICPSIDLQLGGPSRVIIDSARFIDSKLNHELMIFGKQEGNEFPFQVSQIDTCFNNRFGFVIRPLSKESKRHIRESNIVLSHGFYVFTTLIAAYYRKSKPLFIMPHGSLEEYQEKKSRIKKILFRTAFNFLSRHKRIVFLVASQTETVGIRNGFPKAECKVVGLGVNNFQMEVNIKSDPKPDNLTLLSFSRIAQKKRIDISIEAVSILIQLGYKPKLLIAGSGDLDLLERLKRQVASLNLENNVFFIGHIPENRLDEIFGQAHLLLLPSENENFAIAVSESIIRNVPVIVSDQVAMSAFFCEYNTGVVIQNLNAHDLQNAIIRALENYKILIGNCEMNSYLLGWNEVIKNWHLALELEK